MSVQTFQVDNQQWLETISATEVALQHIREQLRRKQKNALRLSLKEAGCTGFKYVLEEVDGPLDRDLSRRLGDGVTLYIDAAHISALKGLQIDLQQVGLNRNLVMNNPNVKDACGCGESFNV